MADTYTGDPTEVDVLKKKTCRGEIRNAATLPKKNMDSQEKKKVVFNQMKYFRIPESAKDFYKDITGNSC